VSRRIFVCPCAGKLYASRLSRRGRFSSGSEEDQQGAGQQQVDEEIEEVDEEEVEQVDEETELEENDNEINSE